MTMTVLDAAAIAHAAIVDNDPEALKALADRLQEEGKEEEALNLICPTRWLGRRLIRLSRGDALAFAYAMELAVSYGLDDPDIDVQQWAENLGEALRRGEPHIECSLDEPGEAGVGVRAIDFVLNDWHNMMDGGIVPLPPYGPGLLVQTSEAILSMGDLTRVRAVLAKMMDWGEGRRP